MVYTDWTFSGDGSGSLDTTIKHSGNSSYKSYLSGQRDTNILKHDTFLEPQATVILWARTEIKGTLWIQTFVNLSTYGDQQLVLQVNDTWEKFKVKYWYDIASNTRFGRVERWIGGVWVQYGIDKNFGSGAPAAGQIGLKQYNETTTTNAWFDDVEVYS